MNIFDLLFMALFLTAVATLLVACGLAVRGQTVRARRVALRVVVAAAAYLGVVAGVSLVLPRRVLAQGTTECFDDWCIAVTHVARQPSAATVDYSVDLRLSSRARRISQRERNLSVYLVDGSETRYNPSRDNPGSPFDVLLHPGDSVAVERHFTVPAAAEIRGLVIAHDGGLPIGWFIIGYDAWFRKPTLVAFSVASAND